MTFSVAVDIEAQLWDNFVAAHPDAHTLQSADWARLKGAFGWSSQRVAVFDDSHIVAGAQILFRPLPLRLGMMAYTPAGPLFATDESANNKLWDVIHRTARSHHAAFLKVEPCNWYRLRPDLPNRLVRAGLRISPQTVQPPRTVVLDISADEETILSRMNQSTRRKVRMKEKKQIDVREGTQADVGSFTRLMGVTGSRDNFSVHEPAYYEKAFSLFSSGERCVLLLASYQGKDLAGVMIFRSGDNAYYLYGASSNEERNRMPTYILQLEAIRWAKRHGAIRYDLWGIPDEDEATLEAQFERRRDGLWGVYGAKRGFGGKVVRSVGAWDKPYNPILYAGYQWIVNRRQQKAQAVLDSESETPIGESDSVE
ncbi:MAG: peptidoglycan bridge formation glycyltransferase FemA/FemB family protein [Anaerolineae bacterium]|nr:peptidoglycan bridge formation glycyltransferase FemA/FemB family protein [Anaerolineae bacterium]